MVNLRHILLLAADNDGKNGVFCSSETFVAQCQANEVIVIMQAFYGRMQLSRYVRCLRACCDVTYVITPG